MDLGWVDLDLGSSLGWWAATVATYCPSRMVEHSKSKSTQSSCQTTSPTLYVAVRPREQGAAMIIRQEEDISAGRVHFGRKVVFRPKVMSFGRFRLSAEIYDLKILSFGSGRKPFG